VASNNNSTVFNGFPGRRSAVWGGPASRRPVSWWWAPASWASTSPVDIDDSLGLVAADQLNAQKARVQLPLCL